VAGGMVNDPALTYDSNWYGSSGRGLDDYNDDVHYTYTNGATAQYTFSGTGIDYLSEKNGDMGNVDVYLDGAFQANVNLYVSGPRQSQQVVFHKTGLAAGTPTIRIVSRTTSVAIVDALKIYP
jgi:alpha-L-fucosidase 2